MATGGRPANLTITVILTALLLAMSDASALTIERDFIGGTPQPNSLGGGNVVDIFNAAADRWELAIRDPFTVTFHYGWAPVGGANHTLNAQGGTPNRETEGTILINNLPTAFRWFLDPTPRSNEEYSLSRTRSLDLGGGQINVGRIFDVSFGPEPLDGIDLYTVALHEIGHGLGMSLANFSFGAESADGAIQVTAPRPFAGTTVPLSHNIFGIDSHPDTTDPRLFDLVMTGALGGGRKDLTGLDILLMGQLSGFDDLNLDLATPEPATLLLFGTTAAGLGLARWRRQRRKGTADVEPERGA
jgi:hypothetical protein